MSHGIEAPFAPRSRSMAGRPTLTTEPPMKARLEPRMVAASVPRGCVVSWLLSFARTDVATPRSQGPAIAAVIVRSWRRRETADGGERGVDSLGDDLVLPGVGVGVEGVADLLLDGVPRRRVCIGMVLEPLVGAQCLDHLALRLGAVLEGHAGVLGLRTFLVGGEPHHAGEQSRRRRTVVDRRDVAPPGPGAGEGGRIVVAGEDAFAMAVRAEACVQIDPGEPGAAGGVIAEYLAQGLIAPGRRRAAEEEAVGMVVLAAGDGLLQRALAAFGDEAVERDHGRLVGWPGFGNDQRRELVVGGVALRPDAEVAEIAIEVDVLVGGAAPPRKSIGVERVDVEHGDAGIVCSLVPGGVFEQRTLHAGAAEAFDAVAGAADDENRRGVAWAVA